MFRWMAYHPATMPWYWAHYTAATMRHAAVGMRPEQHRRLMRLWYGG